MRYSDTTPAPKYGPTAFYGPCEAEACEGTARTTCSVCAGEYCLNHADHDRHTQHERESADSSAS